VKADLHRAAGKTEKARGALSVIQGRVPDRLGMHGEPSVVQGQDLFFSNFINDQHVPLQ